MWLGRKPAQAGQAGLGVPGRRMLPAGFSLRAQVLQCSMRHEDQVQIEVTNTKWQEAHSFAELTDRVRSTHTHMQTRAVELGRHP